MLLRNNKTIELNKKPYIVAELNSSHFGKVNVAKEMILAAKECGCDAVKFQSWTAESLYCKDYYDNNPMAKRMVSGFSLDPVKLKELATYCADVNIDFSSTPYSIEEADFLIDTCEAPFVKIASMDINNIPFLRHVARRNVPIVLSTGMATIQEIKEAVSVIEEAGNNNICVLHCVSEYPVKYENINLRNVQMLIDTFPNLAIGYSDHSLGHEVACAAVGMGVALVEKHFTLDSKRIGWDNQMAIEPAEMRKLVEGCNNVFKAMGSFNRIVSTEELAQRDKMRRSIVTTRDLKAGHVIEQTDITAKRPGTGISVSEYDSIVGRILSKDVDEDRMIIEEVLQ